jgi:PAS domain S-box-containing protein
MGSSGSVFGWSRALGPTGGLAAPRRGIVQKDIEVRGSAAGTTELWDAVPDLLARIDSDRWTLVQVNSAWWRHTGWRPEDLQGRLLTEVVHPSERAALGQVLQDLAQGCVPPRQHLTVARRDGSYGAVEARMRRAESGAIVFSARDAAGRDARFTRTGELVRRLRSAVEMSGIGVWEYETESGRIHWDAHTRAIIGVGPSDELSVDQVVQLYAPEARPVVRRSVERCVSEREPFDLEVPFDGRSERRRWVRVVGRAVTDGAGVRRLIGTFQDVTAHKELERELRASRLAAEQMATAKDHFLATMSHEIRTPMSGVLGMLDMLLETELSPTQHERAITARNSARDLLDILNDILDHTKLENRELQLEIIDFDIESLVDGVIQLSSGRAVEKNVAIGYTVDAGVPTWVRGDPTRLRQVLLNLVGNAVKFTEEGTVSVDVTHEAGFLWMRVVDSGVGLSSEQQGRLFQRFSQADASVHRRYGGSGLGLSICRQLVELMGGEVGVESEVGVGSTFWFFVRASQGRPPERGTSSDSPEASVSLPPLRVLAAEDNRVNQMVLKNLLDKAGHQVSVVANGVEAVEQATAGSFDLMLMDVQMPEMDGIEATRKIRDLPTAAARVPIVALTAHAMKGDREVYLAHGMDDYATKPLVGADLFAAMARAMATRSAGADPKALAAGRAQA